MSKPQSMFVSAPEGRLVPKPFRGYVAPDAERFYNWPKAGRVDGAPAIGERISRLEVPCDEWHIEMAIAGVISVDAPEEAARIVDQMRRDRQLAKERRSGIVRSQPAKAEPKPSGDKATAKKDLTNGD